jgi:hypothetical protein
MHLVRTDALADHLGSNSAAELIEFPAYQKELLAMRLVSLHLQIQARNHLAAVVDGMLAIKRRRNFAPQYAKDLVFGFQIAYHIPVASIYI